MPNNKQSFVLTNKKNGGGDTDTFSKQVSVPEFGILEKYLVVKLHTKFKFAS